MEREESRQRRGARVRDLAAALTVRACVRPQQSYSRRSEASSVVVDDLLQGMNEWRNIQDVIRSTFKALHDVIKAQGDAVKHLERQLEAKANAADVQAALLRKANISDVNRSLTDITHALESKAGVYDLEQRPDRQEVQQALQGKASAEQAAAELASKVHPFPSLVSLPLLVAIIERIFFSPGGAGRLRGRARAARAAGRRADRAGRFRPSAPPPPSSY